MSWSIQEEWSGQTTGVSIESDGELVWTAF
jgi:hypothetical protein